MKDTIKMLVLVGFVAICTSGCITARTTRNGPAGFEEKVISTSPFYSDSGYRGNGGGGATYQVVGYAPAQASFGASLSIGGGGYSYGGGNVYSYGGNCGSTYSYGGGGYGYGGRVVIQQGYNGHVERQDYRNTQRMYGVGHQQQYCPPPQQQYCPPQQSYGNNNNGNRR